MTAATLIPMNTSISEPKQPLALPAELQECLGFLLARVGIATKLAAFEEFQRAGFGPYQYGVLALLRPLAWVPALNGWLVTGRDVALQVMRDAETFTVDDPRFSTGRVVGPSMLTRDGAEHARHREPFAEPLKLALVRERFAPLVEAEVDALIDEIEPDGRAELRRSVAGPLAARVVAKLLGLDA